VLAKGTRGRESTKTSKDFLGNRTAKKAVDLGSVGMPDFVGKICKKTKAGVNTEF